MKGAVKTCLVLALALSILGVVSCPGAADSVVNDNDGSGNPSVSESLTGSDGSENTGDNSSENNNGGSENPNVSEPLTGSGGSENPSPPPQLVLKTLAITVAAAVGPATQKVSRCLLVEF